MARGQKIGFEEKVETAADAVSQSPLFDGSFARMLSWPVEAWLQAQAGILKASEPVATEWFARRREAATATLETIERLATCNDLKEAASIQRGWFEDSMKRLDSDVHAFADQVVAVSRETMSATRYAAKSSTDVVALAIQPAQRAAEQTTPPSLDAAAA